MRQGCSSAAWSMCACAPLPAPPSQVVLTGAKKREDIYRAFENIYPVLQTFRKGGELMRGWIHGEGGGRGGLVWVG